MTQVSEDGPIVPPSTGGKVTDITSLHQVEEVIQSGDLVVLNFGIPWCSFCVSFIPLFREISEEFPTVRFLFIDCDKHKKAAAKYQLEPGFPQFLIIHKTMVQHRIVGGGSVGAAKIRAAVGTIVEGGASIDLGPDSSSVFVPMDNNDEVLARTIFTSNIGGMHDLIFRVLRVRKVRNHALKQKFEAKWKALKAKGRQGSELSEEWAFHSTKPTNIEGICQQNVLMKKAGSTDSGYFGAGLYFSRHPDYTFIYGNQMKPPIAGDRGTVLLFKVLLGRSKQLHNLQMGASLESGYDSHVSPKGFEWVLFDSDQCLPCYVIDWKAEKPIKAQLKGEQWETGKQT